MALRDEAKCVVCGCSESRACEGGCGWAFTEPPCAGVGPAKVARILPRLDGGDLDWRRRAWINVVLAFKAIGQTEADALVQARLARILRTSDYDLERRVILWEPPAAPWPTPERALA